MPEVVSRMQRYRVEGVRREAPDIVSLRLRPEAGPLPAFTAGAHVQIRLGAGIVRAYSLCNGPDERDAFLVAVKREAASTGGSAAVHALVEGDIVEVGAPLNNFELSWSATHLVLIAGGIGITPLMAMARSAAARGHSFELHYFARSPEAAAFAEALRSCSFRERVDFHFGRDAPAVDAQLRAILDGRQVGAEVYVCGPRVLIERVRHLSSVQWPAAAVHWESFGGAAPQLKARDRAIEVRLAHTGRTVHVPPNQTMLQALLAHDVDVPFSCREGQCGMCVVDVIEGEPEHRDDFLNEAAKAGGGCIALCVSRAKTPSLVLDL